MLVEDMILDFGSEVVGPAAQMDEALRFARQVELDAAILDINVGGTVVFPVAEVLRERGIPFIFATGYGSTTLPPRFLNSLKFTGRGICLCGELRPRGRRDDVRSVGSGGFGAGGRQHVGGVNVLEV
jgi:CheY-like chemotaxis protein